MSTAGRSASDRQLLDPDALAALEEERDFLLGSLRDLEREYEAGDIDEDDYLTLRDDYTHRAARTIEAIQQRHDARTAATPERKWSRTLLGVLGVVAFAVVAGWGVAQAAGLRTAGEGLTGDVRLTVGQTLFRCQQLVNAGEIRDSLECYDGVIADHPDNVEAITYRAWTLAGFAGLPDFAWPYFDQVVAIDPNYPDARAFRAIVLGWWCRPEETLAELDAFEASNPLPEMTALIEGNNLRPRAEELLAVRQATPGVAEAPLPVSQAEPTEWDQCPVLADAGVLERVEPESGEGVESGTPPSDESESR